MEDKYIPEDPKNIWKGAIAWMVQNNVAANILMAALLVGGAIFLFNTTQELMPTVETNTVTISITLSGASPEEVEKGIVLAVEEAIRGREQVNKVTSRVNAGRATIAVEPIDGVDRDQFLADIQNTVNRISTLPQEADKPVITLQSMSSGVLDVFLYGSDDMQFLRQWAEIVRDELISKPNITQVSLQGLQSREIQIEVPQDNLRRYGLTLNSIANSIRNASVEQGAGTLETATGDVTVKVTDRRDYAEEFGQIPVVSLKDGSRILLEDIGSVEEGFAERRNWSEFEGTPSILINISRIGMQTPANVAADALEVIDSMNETLPGNLRLEVRLNNATIFDTSSDILIGNALLGIVLVFILLALFLEIKLAFWVSLGIPVSIVGSFLFINPAGVSVSMISMFAFLLTLGIVVDDAIVVGENVYIWRSRGYTPMEASVLGAREISVPIVFSVLTNMVAFLPIMFLPGFMGQMFFGMVVVVNAVFFCSLIESLFVLPCHLAHNKPVKEGSLLYKISQVQSRFSVFFMNNVEKYYGAMLNWFLKEKYIVVSFCFALLLIACGFLFSGRMGLEMMPSIDSEYAFAEIAMPQGTSKEKLQEISNMLYIAAKDVVAENGGDALSRGVYISVNSSSVQGRIYLTSISERPKSTTEVTNLWKQKVGTLEGFETISFLADRGSAGSGKSLSIRLSHRDTQVLQEAANTLAEKLKEYPNINDIDTGTTKNTRELQVQLTPLAEQLGLTSRQITDQIRAAYEGVSVLRQQRGRDEVTVRLRLPENERVNENSFNDLIILTPDNSEVVLKDVVNVVEAYAPVSIRRTDGQRSLDVTANVNPRSESAVMFEEIGRTLMPEMVSLFPGLTWTSSGMQRDIQENMSALYMGLLLVLVAIYVLLAIPFKSYIQPMIIMVAIPFGIIGAIIGHIIMGFNMSVISFMGVLALSGLVVNDALMLIDFANRGKRMGLTAFEAIYQAGIRRFRPIILTTVTTFAGVCPMLIVNAPEAKHLTPVAISLGFGVIFATVITLVLVPTLYLILDRWIHWK